MSPPERRGSPARRPPRPSGASSSSPPVCALLGLPMLATLLLLLQPSGAGKTPDIIGDSSADVCTTCHVNATCQQENGKKFCKCNYGLSGNGRTFCEDKDECRSGMGKICGKHASCHNTHGSYYCVCHEGFQASNKKRQFIPNDGTNCTVVDCGSPPDLPNTYLLPVKETTYGSKVVYICQPGKYNWTAVCSSSGLWEQSDMVCTEINCGRPFSFPNTETIWDNSTTLGSTIYYKCREGFWTVSERNFSKCTVSQRWENITFECKEINCGIPPLINNSVIIWDNISQVGSRVEYKCREGFYNTSMKKHSFCTKNGIWEMLDLQCEKIRDFVNFTMNESCLIWKRLSGNAAITETYQLTVKELKLESKKTNPAMNLNLTTAQEAIEICLQIQQNVNYSVKVTTESTNLALKFKIINLGTDKKEVFRNISVYNDTCVTWQSELGGTQTEKNYVIHIHGLRWYQKHFYYKKTYNFTTSSETPEICFNLPPGSNYSVNISTTKLPHSVLVNMSTPITDPPSPEVEFMSVRGSVPSFRLRKAEEKNGPISSYQVIVIPWRPQCHFNCCSLTSLTYFNQRSDSDGYVAAEFPAKVITDNMVDFALGDRLYYGEFYNAPLTQGKDYCLVLRTISEWNMVKTQSCVVWAQIKDLSSSPQYITTVILVSVAVLSCILLKALGVACSARICLGQKNIFY